MLARDATAEGKFVYAVVTTGVYCRPTCPSRRPLRSNVLFFDSAERAERAGFRPCERCNPRGTSLSERRAAITANACRMLETAEAPPSLRDLARAAGLSPYHFHRLFKKTVGVTPRDYAAAHRQKLVRAGLRSGRSVTEAIYDAGFGSSSRFYERAPQILGMKPKQFLARGGGVTIQHAVVPCPLGHVLIAGTERGICAVHFGDSNAALERQLRQELPMATFVPPNPAFKKWVRTTVREIRRSGAASELPLDIRGTAFQQRVWKALRDIPRGRTATYSEIAARINRPAAVRAVANACASNPVAVLVPCHRAVRSDGQLGGYRWGKHRKRMLLKAERLSTACTAGSSSARHPSKQTGGRPRRKQSC